MSTPKVKATYGKRNNGNRSRLMARDTDPKPSSPRPTSVFGELVSESSAPSTPTRNNSSLGVGINLPQSELMVLTPKPAIKELSSKEEKQANDDEDLFAFPDSPPPVTPKPNAKLNLRRRERAKQKEKEILLRQVDESKKRKERDMSPLRTTPNFPLAGKGQSSTLSRTISDSVSDPLSPPSCLSIENSPEPESTPVTSSITRKENPSIEKKYPIVSKTLSSERNTASPTQDVPHTKRQRIDHNSLNHKSESESTKQQIGLNRNVRSSSPSFNSPSSSFGNTHSRYTDSVLNVHHVTQAEKDTWSFLEEAVPVVKKPKLVANLGPSKFDNSDSDSDNEIDTQTDDLPIPENIYQSLSDRIPENEENVDPESVSTPSQSWQTTRATFSSRKTYGSSRSYLSMDFPEITDGTTGEKVTEPGMDLIDQLGGYMDKEESEDEEDEFGGNIKTVHELRMLGGNTRFQDEVQYILDGLSNGISGKRSSLLELCEKCLDREFVQDFKVSSMPGELFTIVKDETDPITTFLIGFIVCNMLYGDKNIGLAASLVHHYDIVPLLMRMLPDNDDMLLVVLRRNLGTSKVFQQLFTEGLGKMNNRFLQKENSTDEVPSKFIFSRALVALSSFVSLQGLDDKVDNTLVKLMTEKTSVEEFFNFGEDLLSGFLPISQFNFNDALENEEEMRESRANLHLLHLLTAQMEFMMHSTGPNSSIIAVAEMRDPSKNFLLNLLQFIPLLTTYWDSKVESKEIEDWRTALVDFMVSILKLFILITTNYGYQQTSADKYSRKGKLFSKIYEPSLAEKLLRLLVKINDSSFGSIQQHRANNLELFSWGLLINLCESEDICETLLQLQNLTQLKMFLNHEILEQSTASTSHRFHCQGYQSLVAGLLITVKGSKEFSAVEQEHVRRGLAIFKESLSESWGHGLRSQVSRVLSTLENSM